MMSAPAVPQDWKPALVVSDVDGTLIDSNERISPRLQRAVAGFVAEGGYFALATGRPPRWILPILSQLPVSPICVCANGAVLYDADEDRIISVRNLSVAALTTAVHAAQEALADFGGCSIAVERAGASAFDRESELFIVSTEWDHAWESEEHGTSSQHEILKAPAMKLLLRNPKLHSKTMYELVRPAIPAEVAHVTFSFDDGMLEVSAPGVTKASGLKDLADIVGLDFSEMAAFGDMPNDLEMITEARFGVAMDNAVPLLKEAADCVTTSNNQDGVAAVMENWLEPI